MAHVVERPEVPSGATPKVEHVDWRVERAADSTQPLRKIPTGAAALELLVVGAIALRVRRVVERGRLLRPTRGLAHTNSSSAVTNCTSVWLEAYSKNRSITSFRGWSTSQ